MKTKTPPKTAKAQAQSRRDKAAYAAQKLLGGPSTNTLPKVNVTAMFADPTEQVDVSIAKKLIQLKESAASRNLEFNLTFATVKKLMLKKTCFYTGKRFSDPASGDSPWLRTIDRVDNNRGYVNDNVVACCKMINAMKGSLSLTDIAMLFKGASKHINKDGAKTLKLVRNVS